MIKHLFALLLLLAGGAASAAVAFESAHAIVIDEATGEVLLEKDASTAAPIASLTKLMTVMVVLDAQQDQQEAIVIEAADMDHLKRTHGGVPIGASVPRGTLLELALIASDNHAAAALARSYPGGDEAFAQAVAHKIAELGMTQTVLVEPTGLSPHNHASAVDVARLLRATADYPVISAITRQRRLSVLVNGQPWAVRNTNKLVGSAGWDILASKTGFTNEAGRCVSMRLQSAGRTVSVVLLGALANSERALDALNVRRWLAGETPLLAAQAEVVVPRAARAKRGGVRAARVVAARQVDS